MCVKVVETRPATASASAMHGPAGTHYNLQWLGSYIDTWTSLRAALRARPLAALHNCFTILLMDNQAFVGAEDHQAAFRVYNPDTCSAQANAATENAGRETDW